MLKCLMRNVKRYRNKNLLWFAAYLLLSSCSLGKIEDCPRVKSADRDPTVFKTKNVVLVVVDGPRFTETWGDTSKVHVPWLSNYFAPKGVLYENFYNDKFTLTLPGHVAILTGHAQSINNRGEEFPRDPSILHQFLAFTQKEPEKAAIVASKEKMEVLASNTDSKWEDCYTPFYDTEDRSDQETFEKAIEVIKNYQPNLMLIHFSGPDKNGHAGNWHGYLNSIKEDDKLILNLWEYLQSDSYYKGTTTLIVTNDHGRHSDGKPTGFKHHGDSCEGCQHILFYGIGPDFKKGLVVEKRRTQFDIAPTIAWLMGFQMYDKGKGSVMKELFVKEESNRAAAADDLLHAIKNSDESKK